MFSALGNQGQSLPLFAIKTLTRTNYEDWYESLTINLAIMNLDLALRLRHLLNLVRKVLLKRRPTMNVWGIPVGLVL
jgi:4-alpha-glucanotransferase